MEGKLRPAFPYLVAGAVKRSTVSVTSTGPSGKVKAVTSAPDLVSFEADPFHPGREAAMTLVSEQSARNRAKA
jgi:hypothetical protein